jgi:hypothetical protein
MDVKPTRKAAAGFYTVLLFATVAGCEPPHASRSRSALRPVEFARSAPEVEFSQITDVAVDAKGRIYAGDGLQRILVMDETGKLVREFGRMGGGPGEFQSIGTVHLLARDSLFVYDPLAQRATVYEPGSDRVAYTLRFPEPDFSYPMDIEPQRDGSLIGHFRRINGDVPIAGQRRDDVIRILNRDGSIRKDTVITVPEPDVVEVRTERSQGFFLPQFARRTLVRWDDDGRIYSLWTDSARVRVHDATGRSRGSFIAELGTRRLPLAAATIDSVSERNASAYLSKRTLTQAFRSRWQTWPLVEDMLVDDQSRIWIQPVAQTPDATWLAFDAKGTQLATLSLPRSVHPRLIRGDRLYAVSKDSLDVESLVVYRLAPSSTRTPEQP